MYDFEDPALNIMLKFPMKLSWNFAETSRCGFFANISIKFGKCNIGWTLDRDL